ncbi:MAG: ABC transporter permease subunit [Firmicutes bacterium]|nr:ABC transporter permease subunit [Bacillota bacterium]
MACIKKKNQNNITRKIILVLLYTWTFVPFIPILIWSFSLRWNYPNLIPEFSLRAWKYVFTQKNIISSLFSSILISSVVTAISLAIGLPAAKALGMYKFKGKKLISTLVTLPAIVPLLAVAMGIQVVFIKLGLSDSIYGVVLIHLVPVMPYMIMNLSSVYEAYNPEFEQQARVLGANAFTTFYKITIPAILPGIIVASMFSFIVSWSQYLLTLIIGGASTKTLPLLLFAFLNSGDYAIGGAICIIFVLPALILLFGSPKYFAGTKSVRGGEV